MHRVELKAQAHKNLLLLLSFLMHRVELKAGLLSILSNSLVSFLMHRVELKVLRVQLPVPL